MDRSELIQKFIKENLDILISSDFNKHSYKNKKRDFFITKFKARQGSPKDSELAKSLIEYLIKYGQIYNEKILSRYLLLPFFKKNIFNPEYYLDLICKTSKESQLDIDFASIRQEHYRQEIEKKIIEGIKQKVIESETRKAKEEIELVKEELKEAIERKKDEYHSLPSILDIMDYPEPDISASEEQELGEFISWWRNLGLLGNPFPTQEGLTKIDNNLYETVVIKTDIFNKFLYLIRYEKQQLFRNAILFGDFGTGKTTLYDYLMKHFLDENILPLYIQLIGERDFRSLYIAFQKEIYIKLSEYYVVINREDPRTWLDSQTYEDSFKILFEELNKQKYSFIVIIDDLHKNREREEINTSLKFINNLQILTSKINREIPGIDIAFLISGSRDWERIIEKDPKFSGSYIKNYRMPQITEEIAIEMLNRRLNAFTQNPDKNMDIDTAFIKKIYRELERQNKPITYRSFIKSVEEEFESGNYSILSCEPAKLDERLLSDIRNYLESYIDLKKGFQKLIFSGGIQKEGNRRKILNFLIKTYLDDGIREDSRDFKENPFYFQKLAHSKLIQKLKLPKNEFKWVVTTRLLNANKRILEKYKCSMEDYLIQLYLIVPKKKKAEGPKESSKKQIQEIYEFIQEIPEDYSSLRYLLNQSLKIHSEILEIKDSVKSKELPDDLKNSFFPSFSYLTRALALYQEVPISEFVLSNITEFWRTYWNSIPEVMEFLNLINAEDDISDKIWYVLSMYQDAYLEIFQHLRKTYNESKYFSIDINNLTRQEIIFFNKIRVLWSNRYYFRIVKLLSEFMEKKFRVSIFNFLTLLYGDNRKDRLDKTSADYIEKGIREARENRRRVSNNDLDYLNRGNWKNFVTGIHNLKSGRKNWEDIFQHIFLGQSQKDIDKFLSIFALFNIESSHNKEDSLSAEHQSEIFSFTLNCMNITKAFNEAYFYLLDKGFFIEQDSHGDYKCYFSFSQNKDIRSLTPILMKKNEIKRILELFRNNTSLSIDIEDFKFIYEVYKLDYRNFLTAFALLKNSVKLRSLEISKKLIIKKSVGTTCYFHVEE